MHGLVRASYTLHQGDALTRPVLVVAAAVKDDQVRDVAAQAEDGSDQHYLSIDINRVDQSVNRLDQEPDQQPPNDRDTRQRANHVGSLVAIGVLERLRLPR